MREDSSLGGELQATDQRFGIEQDVDIEVPATFRIAAHTVAVVA